MSSPISEGMKSNCQVAARKKCNMSEAMHAIRSAVFGKAPCERRRHLVSPIHTTPPKFFGWCNSPHIHRQCGSERLVRDMRAAFYSSIPHPFVTESEGPFVLLETEGAESMMEGGTDGRRRHRRRRAAAPLNPSRSFLLLDWQLLLSNQSWVAGLQPHFKFDNNKSTHELKTDSSHNFPC